jgi:hypothetical protein
MAAQFLKFGDPPPTWGGEFERTVNGRPETVSAKYIRGLPISWAWAVSGSERTASKNTVVMFMAADTTSCFSDRRPAMAGIPSKFASSPVSAEV